jgi:uncharacterized protein
MTGFIDRTAARDRSRADGADRTLHRSMKSPGRFDGFSVAAQGGVIAGKVDAAALPRVADLIDAQGGASDVEYRITGASDAAGHPALEVVLAGTVPLTCQRCLQPFRWPVEQTTLLLLARDQRELTRLDDEDHEHEVVLADGPLDPLGLVEDELLLTLPFVPRCPEGECPAAPGRSAPAQDAAGAHSAFSALKALKSDPGKKAPG